MRVVVDASVAAQWLAPEPHSQHAALLLGAEHDLFAPDLLLSEVSSLLAKKVRRAELTAGEATSRLAFVEDQVVCRRSVDVVDDAFALALSHQCSPYDALYAAVAIVEDVPLVTADQRLIRGLRSRLGDTLVWIGDVTTP